MSPENKILAPATPVDVEPLARHGTALAFYYISIEATLNTDIIKTFVTAHMALVTKGRTGQGGKGKVGLAVSWNVSLSDPDLISAHRSWFLGALYDQFSKNLEQFS